VEVSDPVEMSDVTDRGMFVVVERMPMWGYWREVTE
jgi:hypothetical protein